MNIIIHRGSNQVGGTCIEISTVNSCILLDFGLPLSFEFGEDIKSCLPEPLFSQVSDKSKKVDAVFLSHAHLDHYGLAGELPEEIPIYLSNATRVLMGFNEQFTPNKIGNINSIEIKSHQPEKIGDLTVTPYLMDHSAFDAHGFLVEAEGKAIFYTGDFRGHGVKKELLDQIPARLPHIDILLMEGTVIGERENELFKTEKEIEEEFANLFNQVEGPVLITVPSQNIDRIIALFNAVNRSYKKLVIDLYSAELFRRLKQFSSNLPQSGIDNVDVWYPYIQRENLVEEKLYWVMKTHKRWKQKLTEISSKTLNPVILLRPPFRKEIGNNFDLSKSIWVYSMWTGYFERSEALQRLQHWAEEKKIPLKIIHTSGHAKLQDLKQFVSTISPGNLIPVHSFHPDQFSIHFDNVKMVQDGEIVSV